MKKFLALAVFALPFTVALAQENQPKHIISIGTDGFGWSGLSQTFNWDKDKSGVKDHEASEANLNLNYHYVFPTRFMIGAIINVETSESEIKETNGDKTESEESASEVGLSLGYNFSDDFYNAWWVAVGIGSGKYESVDKDSSGKEEFEYDYSFAQISFGKRFNLDSWGLKNISYNPTISFASATISGDAEDAGLEDVTQGRIDLIKFDILF